MSEDRETRDFWRDIDAILEGYAQRMPVHSPRHLGPLLEALDAWMQELGYSRKDICAAKLAVHEAGINAFRRGPGGDPHTVVHARYLVTPSEVLVEM